MSMSTLLPRVEAEVCLTALLARDRGGKGWFAGHALTSRGEESGEAITKGVVPADNCHILPLGAVNSMATMSQHQTPASNTGNGIHSGRWELRAGIVAAADPEGL
jgi:hypothetical protein